MLSSRARRAFPLYICCLTTFTSVSALADNTLFTAMDDPATAKKPFEGNVQAGYNAQSGNSQSSTLLANTNMTWFNTDAAYSLWGAANNTTSSNVRSSEKYQAGGRTRYNLTDRNYLFGQASWLSDRFNGYDSRSTLTSGYGRQILNGPLSDLRVEFGPGVYGAEAASRRYFGKSAGDLNVEEAALLAAAIVNPRVYSPARPSGRLLRRQQIILGRLGVLCVGLGAVTTTFMAGVEQVRQGHGRPFGSLTQMATIRLGKRTEGRSPLIRDFVPLAGLDDLVFGAWDPIPDNAYEAALKCGVLDRHEPIASRGRIEVRAAPVRAGVLLARNPPGAFGRTRVERAHLVQVRRIAERRLARRAQAVLEIDRAIAAAAIEPPVQRRFLALEGREHPAIDPVEKPDHESISGKAWRPSAPAS